MIQLVLIAVLLVTVVWFTYAGFMAASLVGGRWLPVLAFGSILGAPLVLGYVLYGVMFRQIDDLEGWHIGYAIAGGSIGFSRYALLALMLYLIARRLPEGSHRAEGDEAIEGGD